MDGIRDEKGRILKNTDPLFTEIAENYPSNNYISFCNEFGVRYNQADQILRTQNLGNQTIALKQVLNKWVNDGKEVTKGKLQSALNNAQTGGLISIVKKHFNQYAVEEGSCEGAGNNQDDATQANNQAGPSSGQNVAIAGNTFNVTNNFAAETMKTAEDRKRGVDESDRPPDKKKATESTMSMTYRHRKILEKSAPVLLNDLDSDDVLPHILGDGVISPDDVAKVNSKATRKEKVAALLEILPRRGDDAYDCFLKSLEKTKGSRHLYLAVKKYEENYQEQHTEETPIGQELSSSPDQPSARAGVTLTQQGVNMTISASGSSTIQNNTITGQTYNVTPR